MPNWKKLIVSGSDASLNSLTVLNGITGSLFGTASYAQTSSYSTNLVVSGGITQLDYIDFDTTANPTYLEGRVHWNADVKTLQIDTDRSNFSIDVGHQSVVRVYNDTGVDINSGSVVYINGAQGNTPTIATASWEQDPSSAGTIGFAATTIPGSGGNRHGYVITSGLITNINTNGFAVGDRLYLSSSGQFTNVAPDAPLHEVRLGVVIVNNATTGIIFVNVVNGFEITELHDVRTTIESPGDLLIQSASLWTNSKQLTGSYGLTGSLTATSFTGSLFGTSSWATNAITASFAPNYVLTSVTSSMTVLSSSFASTASFINTLNQNVIVSGSINVSGSIEAAYKSPYTAKSAAYTATVFDSTIEFTANSPTCSLYTANGNAGRQLYIKNDGTGLITVDANGSETIDGQLIRSLAQYEDLLIQADGTSNWIILNRKPNSMVFQHSSLGPLDATTYYFGPIISPPATAESVTRQVVAPASGWIRTVTLAISCTAGSSGNSTFTIRNVTTNTNSTISSTIVHNVAAQHNVFTLASPLQVRRGDYLTILWTTPTWATDPSVVISTVSAFVD